MKIVKTLMLLCLLTTQILALNLSSCINCQNLKDNPPKKVYATTPTLLYQLYAIDKSKAMGLVFEFWDMEKRYLDSNFTSLPVLGGFTQQGTTANMEQILSLKPDLIITTNLVDVGFKKLLEKTKIPTLYVDALSLDENLNSFAIIGEILGKKERALELQNYAKESIKLAKDRANKASKKPKIYYAYGEDGTQTECEMSSFGEIVKLVGADLVHKCDMGKRKGRVSLNFEQILNYQPDIIIAYHKAFYDKIYLDPKWSHIKAVKNKRVYLIPRKPFSWLGKPASFMRFLGVIWLLDKVYPELNIDITEKTKEFYKLFLYFEPTKSEIDDILCKDGLCNQ